MKSLFIAAALAVLPTLAMAETCGHGADISAQLRREGLVPMVQGVTNDNKLDEELWITKDFGAIVALRSKHDGETDAACYEVLMVGKIDPKSLAAAIKKFGAK